MLRARPRFTILCVDDEVKALEVRRMVLQSAGFRVCTAVTAGEAIRIAETEPLDLVLTDYYLDGSTGGELARELKNRKPHLPVAVYSGAAELLPEDTVHADMVIPKTGGPRALIDEIEALLLSRERKAA
jgi:CheY-like chemotaxis protein